MTDPLEAALTAQAVAVAAVRDIRSRRAALLRADEALAFAMREEYVLSLGFAQKVSTAARETVQALRGQDARARVAALVEEAAA
jgi:hypothetical protein